MKKVLSVKSIIVISILIISLVFILILLFYNPFIYFKVDGKTNLTINVNDELKLPRIKAYLFNKDISKKINKKGSFNKDKVGTYKIIYEVKSFFTNKSLVVKINIVDNKKPNIILNGNEIVTICPNSKYVEEGYTAIDNYDGDITKNVIRKEYDGYVKYSVKDS